jgi:hypothetical protein
MAYLEYRKAREACRRRVLELFRAGDREVVFPEGTWFAHFRYGCRREEWGPSFWDLVLPGGT